MFIMEGARCYLLHSKLLLNHAHFTGQVFDFHMNQFIQWQGQNRTKDRWLACVKLINPRWYTDKLVTFIVVGNNPTKFPQIRGLQLMIPCAKDFFLHQLQTSCIRRIYYELKINLYFIGYICVFTSKLSIHQYSCLVSVIKLSVITWIFLQLKRLYSLQGIVTDIVLIIVLSWLLRVTHCYLKDVLDDLSYRFYSLNYIFKG